LRPGGSFPWATPGKLGEEAMGDVDAGKASDVLGEAGTGR
jgi:hypothetical protein